MRIGLSCCKAALLMLTALFLTGCWDNKDINHRLLPVVMGVAKAGDDYRIILQIPEPIENSLQLKIVAESGKTITQAVDRMSENMESQVDLLHLKLILIDKKLAAKGMSDVFSFFMRVSDISPKALVVISEENPEKFFYDIKSRLKPEGSNVSDFFEKNAGWNAQIAITRIWQVYRSIHSYTQDVVLPIVKPGKSTTIDHLGSSIIKNGKLVGQIDPDETLLFNMFNGQSGHGKIEVLDHASVLINNTSLKQRSRIIRGTPQLSTLMTLKVSVLEIRGNVSMETIEKELRVLIIRRFEKLLSKAKRGNADILSLGQEFRRIIPRSRLQNWREEIYPRLNVNFDVKVFIQNEGFLRSE